MKPNGKNDVFRSIDNFYYQVSVRRDKFERMAGF